MPTGLNWELLERLDVLTNCRPVTEADIPHLVERFREILCLYNWRVRHKVVDDKQLGQSLMMIKPNRDRQMATIYIRRSIIGRPTKEVGPLLLHEMLHLVLEPIVEEHTWQLEYEIGEARAKEYERRFVRCLEKTVELMTDNLAKLIQLNEQDTYQLKEIVLEGIQAEVGSPVYAVGDNDDDEEFLALN